MKKQVEMCVRFCILSVILSALGVSAKAEAVYGEFDENMILEGFRSSNNHMIVVGDITEEEAGSPWGWSLLSLSASGSWDITAIVTNPEGVVLITGWFRGTLFWGNGSLEADQRVWSFVITSDQNGLLGAPRLLGWEPGLVPLNARPIHLGFQILALEMENGSLRQLVLDMDGTVVEARTFTDLDFDLVLQPEDLPEGSGG